MSKRSRRPEPVARTDRRPATRPLHAERPALERHRGLLLGGVGASVLVLVGVFLFFSATSKAYACTDLSTIAPSATPQPDGSPPPLGQPQDDMGRRHIENGASARYSACPPASGPHYNAPGGPISARFYGRDDATVPQGWIHNLEHGGLVVLYRCTDGQCDDATQQRLRQFVADFPPSPICNVAAGTTSPVVTRFDEMSTPFAALVWDRILLLDSLDTDAILEFYATQGERTNPEPQCVPSPSPSPESSPSASPSPGSS